MRLYTTKRATRRWPLALFMNMLDVAGVAAYVIWLEQMPGWSQDKSNKRHIFLSQLGESLVLPEQQRRLQNPRALQAGPKLALQLLGFNTNPPLAQVASTGAVQGRCHVCARNKDRKVRTRCTVCDRFCCSEHSAITCDECSSA